MKTIPVHPAAQPLHRSIPQKEGSPMFGRLDSAFHVPGGSVARGFTGIAALILLTAAGCDQPTTAPEIMPAPSHGPSMTVAPGTLAVYTDRTAWLAAVAAEGATAQEFDYTGLTLGRITSRSHDYGPFTIAVDFLASNTYNNPGIDIMPDANCSIGTGDCNRMIYNMLDPSFTQTYPYDQPKVDSLIMPQPIVAFAAYFAQVGFAVGCGASCPAPTGPVTIHFGGATYVLNDGIPTGYGFLGFIAGTPSDNLSFTFAKTGTWANDVIEVYRPEFANATLTPTAFDLITDLRTYVAGAGLSRPISKKIDQKLQLAYIDLAANQTSAACTDMQDVIDYTNAQSVRKIPADVKTEIVSQSNAIRTKIGC